MLGGGPISAVISADVGKFLGLPFSYFRPTGLDGAPIGSTNRLGEVPKDRPVKMQEIFATLYHNLGIDPSASFPNHAGRPMSILDVQNPMKELV